MQNTQTLRGLLLSGVALTALVAGGATAAPDTQVARITGLVGEAKADGSAANQHGVLGEDGRIETEEDGNCSILLDENALLEMCGETSVQFSRKPGTRNRIVKIDAGEVRMVVEPRAPGDRIDIVTPAAVATIMGTIISIVVDPVTGETTLSSTESSMVVRAPENLQQQFTGSTTVSAAETVTLMPGDDPSRLQVRELDRQALAGLTDCLTDLREAAVAQDRVLSMSKAANRVSTADSEAINEADVAAAAGVDPTAPAGNDPPTPGDGTPDNNVDPPQPTDGGEELLEAAMDMEMPRPQPGGPGDPMGPPDDRPPGGPFIP